MRIDVRGDESISAQARTYAEYRLFASLSQQIETDNVRRASLLLRRPRGSGGGDVVCTVTIAFCDGGIVRARTTGTHPYEAINEAVARLRLKPPARPYAAEALSP